MKSEKQKRLLLIKLLPNTITMVSLCFGLTSIKLALAGNFEKAALFIVIAAVLDVVDGRFARLLNAQSKIGANLDSLCDFINFGLAPVFIMYLWGFKDVKIFGWGVVLMTVVCTCIRLARFNVQEEDRGADGVRSHFFAGIPSTAGGLLILAPLILSFDIADTIVIHPTILLVYTMFIAILMASTIPTISTKKIKIKHSLITPMMIIIGILLVISFLHGWLFMLLISILYLFSIPYSYFRYKKMLKYADSRREEVLKLHQN